MGTSNESDRSSGGLADAPMRAALGEFPPSVKLVAFALHMADEPLTKRQIGERTLLADRTIRYALSRLEEAELVRSRPLPSDIRQQLFWLHD